MSTKISPHLTLEEIACHDPERTPYPAAWRLTRLPPLLTAYELVRGLRDLPVAVLSGYRTKEWNAAVGGAERSQHVEGRALDLKPPEGVAVQDFWEDILRIAHRAGITGVGYAPPSEGGYVHIDIRPSPRLVQWRYPLVKKGTVK
jgi:uncharacterized protein YcbK (DUF882 family)